MYNLVCDEPNRRQPGSGLKFSGVHIDVNIKPDQIPRPLSPEQLNQFGLDSYAIDLLDGPAPVLSWLCLSHNLHRMPIQINRRQVDAKAIEATRQVQRYYTRDGSSSIRFSMYGNRLAQLETRTLQRAKILNTGGASPILSLSFRCPLSPRLRPARSATDAPLAASGAHSRPSARRHVQGQDCREPGGARRAQG